MKKDAKFVIYAHRGASEYYPENTASSFRAGLVMGADGIETDVQRTKDGVLVLFHDDTLERVTGEPGCVSDYTWEELSRFTVRNALYGREDRILPFRDFLEEFGREPITFAIELKQRGLSAPVVAMLDEYGMQDKAILTSFLYEELADAAALTDRYRIGWLYVNTDETTVEKLSAIRACQACPKAQDISKEDLDLLYRNGFDVRAWGIFDETIMRRTVEIGVNAGMTVNFPDRLVKYFKEN